MTHQTVNGVDRDNDPSIYADDCEEPKIGYDEFLKTFRDRVHSTPDLNRGISGLKDDAGFVHSAEVPYYEENKVYQNSGIPNTRDLPTVANSEGGLQSDTLGRFDLIPGEALVSLAGVYGAGAKKYTENNWHKITERDHVNHALEHLAMYLMGRSDEPHLDHALCRLSMALWARENRKELTVKEQYHYNKQQEFLKNYAQTVPGRVVDSGPITFERGVN